MVAYWRRASGAWQITTSADSSARQRFCSSLVKAAAVAFAVCLPDLAGACQISLTGTQPGVSNSAPIDCISITNANVTGNVNNTGSILLNGITVTNSTVNGAISNIGSLAGGNIVSFAGGILADDRSSITGSGGVGIGIIDVPTFTGGIASGATMTANNGIYVDSVHTFAGGINNTGRITAGNGLSVSNISAYSGGISNSGQLIATNYGISILSVTNFVGGFYNTGDITSTGVNRAGVSFYNSSFSGGITNSGRISAVGAGITLGDLICVCIQPVLNFSGLQGIEWVILRDHSGGTACGYWLLCAWSGVGIWHDTRWPKQQRAGGVCRMDIRSRVSVRRKRYAAFSVIRMYGSSTSTGAQKNSLRLLRAGPDGLV
jgi:hypothetical protein